jgi:hypothetical protein
LLKGVRKALTQAFANLEAVASTHTETAGVALEAVRQAQLEKTL